MYKILEFLKHKFFSTTLKNNIFFQIDNTSIISSNSNIRFDVGHDKRNYVSIGRKCLITANFIFESKNGFIKIGDNVNIGGANFISRVGIIIGNDVTMAWGITIYDHNSHSIYWDDRSKDNEQCYSDFVNFNNAVVNKNWDKVNSGKIIISDKAWIGFDVLILKGVVIGEGAVIGAKSVVTKDVPAWTVCAGNPAKVVKYLK